MSALRLLLATLFHYRHTNLAVACGVAVAAAVLSGALLVGDSMHGSLERLALERLGRIDQALLPDRFFRAALADELAAQAAARRQPLDAAPAILLRASLENPDSKAAGRIAQVDLVGCDARFWQLGSGGPKTQPGPREVVLNRTAAERLGVGPGDTLLLRLPRFSLIPADSALGKKKETIRTERVVVREIIADEGLGRFGLWPTQRPPRNACAALAWLQQCLAQPTLANALLVADRDSSISDSRRLIAAGNTAADLANLLRPSLSDYGLRVDRTPLGYWNITCDRMLFSPAIEQAILHALSAIRGQGPGFRAQGSDSDIPRSSFILHPSLTYLANSLSRGSHQIPYSTITALDFGDRPPLGPFRSPDGRPLRPLGPGEIALNSWAADQLGAKPGDTIRLAYFEPESASGQVRETSVSLRLAAIVELSGPAADRSLVPAVKGMTDEVSMSNWDPPFPFDARRIRPADEQYWRRYGPTPKAFVSLATGRQIWASRFGQTTSIRVAWDQDLGAELERRLDPAAIGFVFQPVRSQALAAAAGTTPFGVLFLSFSFFLIAAAAMLVALLFRLGVEQRARQIGTLLALGLSRRQVGRLLLGEGLLVAAAGSLLGVPLGIGYAGLMLFGLQTWWLPAIGTPLLRLHVTTASLAVGCISGLAVALAAIWFSLRGIGRLPPRQLLAGQTTSEDHWDYGGRRRFRSNRGPSARTTLRNLLRPLSWVVLLLSAAPVIALLVAPQSDRFLGPGTFFAAGIMALAALWALIGDGLGAGATGPAVTAGRGNLVRLALRNAARNPSRSALCMGLVAAASFLIVATSAFRIESSDRPPALGSGDGGFALVAETDQPIFQNLDTPEGRRQLGFSAEDEKLLARATIVSLRVHGGDDASCLNLYRARQPRVLGVPAALMARGGFAWAQRVREPANPWSSLNRPSAATVQPAGRPQPVPVILDRDTANYALNLWGGIGQTFSIPDARRNTIPLQIAGLLGQSIFQGDLLMGEQEFLRSFPETSGYRFFLVAAPPQETVAVGRVLQRELADYGWTAQTTGRRLADLHAVQNTYLSAFQSLGGLGLLLGTLGLAAVQWRSVLERRGELALLLAVGFRRRTVGWLLLAEHAALLAAGLGIGLVAAAAAVLPHLLSRAAPLPYVSLSATLAIVLAAGVAAGGLAAHAALRAPLSATLREERP